MKSAPARTFFSSRSARKASGGTHGFSAAPRNTRGGVVSLRPDRNVDSSRMVFSARNSEIESRSKTGRAPGWSPTPTPSPVRHRMLPTPMAAAPSTSPWMPMRLRSRHEICSTTP
jgi:hypothetical protein